MTRIFSAKSFALLLASLMLFPGCRESEADGRRASPDYRSHEGQPVTRDYDCSDFDLYREALAFYHSQGGPERDPHRLDADRDGIPCESLRP